MDRRRFAVGMGTLVGGFALPARAWGQSRRIGVLFFGDRSETFVESFRLGLRDHGLEEGRNLDVEWRFADGVEERAVALARELVSLKVEVIVASLTGAVLAARQATSTIPIVMAPAGLGLVKNLARPEANITGASGASAEVAAKRLELLQSLIPGLKTVAMLINGNDAAFGARMLDETLKAIRGQVEVRPFTVNRPGEFAPAFAAMSKERIIAAIVQPSLVVPVARAAEVAALGLRNRIALASQSQEFVEAGGLLSYGANFRDRYRYAASYVARLLKGAKPGDLPVDIAQRYEMILNAKTAREIGIVIPEMVLVRADLVIN